MTSITVGSPNEGSSEAIERVRTSPETNLCVCVYFRHLEMEEIEHLTTALDGRAESLFLVIESDDKLARFFEHLEDLKCTSLQNFFFQGEVGAFAAESVKQYFQQISKVNSIFLDRDQVDVDFLEPLQEISEILLIPGPVNGERLDSIGHLVRGPLKSVHLRLVGTEAVVALSRQLENHSVMTDMLLALPHECDMQSLSALTGAMSTVASLESLHFCSTSWPENSLPEVLEKLNILSTRLSAMPSLHTLSFGKEKLSGQDMNTLEPLFRSVTKLELDGLLEDSELALRPFVNNSNIKELKMEQCRFPNPDFFQRFLESIATMTSIESIDFGVLRDRPDHFSGHFAETLLQIVKSNQNLTNIEFRTCSEYHARAIQDQCTINKIHQSMFFKDAPLPLYPTALKSMNDKAMYTTMYQIVRQRCDALILPQTAKNCSKKMKILNQSGSRRKRRAKSSTKAVVHVRRNPRRKCRASSASTSSFPGTDLLFRGAKDRICKRAKKYN